MQQFVVTPVELRPKVTYRAKSVRRKVWEMTGGQCFYCGATLDHPESTDHIGVRNFTVDHVVPISLGGSDDLANLVPCCKQCNSSKCDRLIPVWEKSGVVPRYPFGRHPLSDHEPVEYVSLPKQELYELRQENERLQGEVRLMRDDARIKDKLLHDTQQDRRQLIDQRDQIQKRLEEANEQILMLLQKVGSHERD